MAASAANAKKTDDECLSNEMWHCDHCDVADNLADKNFCWDCGVARPGTDGAPEPTPAIADEEIATSDKMLKDQLSAAIGQRFTFIRLVDGVMTSTDVDPKKGAAPAAPQKRGKTSTPKPAGRKRGRKAEKNPEPGK